MGRVRPACFTRKDRAYGASYLPKTTVLQSIDCENRPFLCFYLMKWLFCIAVLACCCVTWFILHSSGSEL